MYDAGKIVPGILIFVAVLAFPFVYTAASGRSDQRPDPKLPEGEKSCVESTEYTLWTSVADTKNLKYYYRVYENPAIYELDLTTQDPNGTAVLTDDRPSHTPIMTVPVQFA